MIECSQPVFIGVPLFVPSDGVTPSFHGLQPPTEEETEFIRGKIRECGHRVPREFRPFLGLHSVMPGDDLDAVAGDVTAQAAGPGAPSTRRLDQ